MKKKQSLALPTPTEQQFQALNKAYQYFNRKLFNKQLPGCILNFSRKKNTHGFMAPQRWRRVGEEEYSTHEISLTPTTLYRSPIEVFSTLVHEQVHLWQWDFGSPSRSGYHNQEWANKMEEIGLMPSNTGKPRGKRTGQRMTHYIIPGGKYERAFNAMPKKYTLPFASLEGDIFGSIIKGGVGKRDGKEDPQLTKLRKLRPTSRKKVKYSCPGCGINVWGKPNLVLVCKPCNNDLTPQSGSSKLSAGCISSCRSF